MTLDIFNETPEIPLLVSSQKSSSPDPTIDETAPSIGDVKEAVAK